MIINHEIKVVCELCNVTFHSIKALIVEGMETTIKVTPHKCKEEEEEEEEEDRIYTALGFGVD